ncbi:flagellar hook-associated family protein [Aquabacter cavernae]|uniref:flagellar hook-associated family protein n=1 Tax=Aquabacter cavernae TaxID=2496029 RepID=UPI000F8E61F0|nr:flagellar hook-associated family protein [Aquabacter cavernae]
MRTTFISTQTIQNSPRTSIIRLQQELTKTNTELVTGSRADIGLDYGVRSDASVELRNQKARYEAMIQNNTAVSIQLKTTENGLTDLRDNAQEFLDSLIALNDASASPGTLASDARSKLDSLISTLNVSDGRRYLFGGVQSGSAPMSNYADGAQASVITAFQTAFGGRTPDDTTISDITPADMETFLNGAFAAEFEEPAWGTNWSSASDEARSSAISPSETMTTSVSANETAMRKLAMAYTMVAEFSTSNLDPKTLEVVATKAREILGVAVNGLIDASTQMGSVQARITTVNDQMTKSTENLKSQISSFESVDPSEAKTKVDLLTTQIEMSYSLTSQIMKLSILNYV